MKEYFEYNDKKGERFWEIDWAQGGCDVAIRYGKIGCAGRRTEKSLKTATQAQLFYEKQKNAKLKKGYVLRRSEASTIAPKPEQAPSRLIQHLCSLSEDDQRLGLEVSARLLTSDPDALDIPALVVLGYVNIGYDDSTFSDIRKKALELLQRLPGYPKEFGGRYENRYIKYVCENGCSLVITRMIQLCLGEAHGRDSLDWSSAYLRALPEQLRLFPFIRLIDLRGASLTAFPEVFFDLPKLSVIGLYGSRIKTLPAKIGSLKRVYQLVLGGNALSSLPDEISQMSGLTDLDVCNNELTELPDSMAKMLGLRVLDISGNGFTALADAIGKLKDLDTLFLGANQFSAVPECLAEMVGLERVSFDDNPMIASGQVAKLFSYFHENTVDVPTRRIWINLISARYQRVAELADVGALVAALDSGLIAIRSNALIVLATMLDTAYQGAPLGAGCKLAVVGNTGQKVGEIRARLEEYGIDVTSSIKQDTTHVLLGQKPAKKASSVLAFGGVLLCESQLMGFLHTQETPLFLDKSQDTGDAQQSISALLMSDDRENQMLALEMLKRTAVSSEVMAPLYLIYRLTEDKAVRETAKALLLQYASADFSQMINKNQSFRTATEKAADRYMNELAVFEDLDVTALSRLCCQKRGLGLNYFFEHGAHEHIVEALSAMRDSQGVLDLGYRYLREVPEVLADVAGIKKLILRGNLLTRLPASLNNVEGLTEIDVSGNKLTSFLIGLPTLTRVGLSDNRLKAFPAVLLGCPMLESLSIDANPIRELPADLSGLSSLKALTYGWETMRALPASIGTLTQLRELRVFAKSLEPLPAQFCGLKDLRCLHMSGCGLTSVPAQLLEFENLRELNLSSNDLTSLPQGISRLCDLETIDVMGNEFTQFPLVLTHMTNLRVLRFNWRWQHDIPDALSNLIHLQELQVGRLVADQARALLPASCVVD